MSMMNMNMNNGMGASRYRRNSILKNKIGLTSTMDIKG